jgi:hypothetical protein
MHRTLNDFLAASEHGLVELSHDRRRTDTADIAVPSLLSEFPAMSRAAALADASRQYVAYFWYAINAGFCVPVEVTRP